MQQLPVAPILPLDDDHSEEHDVPMVDVQVDEVANNWAIVVYQPPVHVPVVHIANIAVPFGPPLPPEMTWRRSFENLLEAPMAYELPKPISFQPVSPVILSKRSWDFAFR